MKRNEIEVMTVICNIQAMQQKVYGKAFDYDDFKGNTTEELYNLQDSLIPLYNESFINQKSLLTKNKRSQLDKTGKRI